MAPSPSPAPHVLLINPWIHDFAAYDVWAKPMGLLMLGAILRLHGIQVSYIDCLDRFHAKARATDPFLRNGRGPYLKTPLENPKGLEDIDRRFSRYGIRPDWLTQDLKNIAPPDLILVTSLMTYWYPGTIETIQILKKVFPRIPVILGGIYPTLFPDHAQKTCGADRVVSGPGTQGLLKWIQEYTGYRIEPAFDPEDLNTFPYPAFDLQTRVSYVPLLTSLGCPFSCAYCASPILNPKHLRRNPEAVVKEILHWHGEYGVKDFVFYDDALLVNPERHIFPMLKGVLDAGIQVRFHTPNAVHAREVTREMALLMKASGFHTLRLGVETGDFSNRSKDLDQKLTLKEFKSAVQSLQSAGFSKSQVGAYLLTGLPEESEKEVALSIDMVKNQGLTPVLAYYTPLPGTGLWEKAKAASRYDLEADPIFTNNAIFPCSKEPFSWQRISRLKARVRG
ncbi:MAG: B12-binding domain-containing radical SAM protein [Proteobacteria bacterium]|nr:B12-binding domain-containing radical SAM protein [Pseudomonadota bacterium]